MLTSIGQTVQLAARVFDQNNSPMNAAVVTWTSGNLDVATVSAQGLVTAVKNGVARITATSGSASSGVDIKVMQSADSIVIEPQMATLISIGDTVQLSATVLDGSGQPVADAVVTWQSSDEGVATVSAQGLVTAVKNGVARITATSGSASSGVDVKVMQSAGSIVIEPQMATLISIGDTVQLSATVLDGSGQPVADAVVTWQSSDEGVATVSAQGLVTAVKNGVARITATSGSASSGVDVKVMQSAGSIVIEPQMATLISIGDTVQLSATVLDGSGQPVADAVVTWQSSDEGVATVSAQGLVTAIGNGVVRIVAASGTASQSIDVEVQVRVPSPDRARLVLLYHAMDGPNWENNTNWLSDKHVDDWFGVNTDEEGRVTSLNLGKNRLKGQLPPQLAQLNSLEGLSLEENQLTGPILPELGQLVNLTHLYLFKNQLTGSIPPELGRLVNLIHLCLNSNQLAGSIPPELGQLKSLKWLHLQFNRDLKGFLPVTLIDVDLEALLLQGTLVCLPDDPDVQRWLLSIPEVREGECERLDQDRNALVALYHATNGSEWKYNGNWLSKAPLGEWRGVVTDENGRVTELRLGFNGLSGFLPRELAQLTHLSNLDLDSNQITGEIPAEIGKLANLIRVRLCNNSLQGNIPAELGNLRNLQELALCGNRLSGGLPEELGQLTSLAFLQLDDNLMTGSIPAEIGQLENLSLLRLGGNQFTGSIPSELGQLTNLTELSISYTPLTGSIPAELGNLINLRMLNLEENQLSGNIPAELAQLSKLNDLILRRNHLSGSIPADLGDLNSLTFLSLNNNQLSGSIPAELGDMTSLTDVNLNSNRLSGSIPAEIGNLTNLRFLIIQNNQLSGAIPAELGNMTSLNVLALDNNHLSGSIPGELGNLTNLSELFIAFNQLSGSVPAELGQLTNLQRLSLYTNRLSGSIPVELGQLPDLSVLNLGSNNLTGSIPIELGQLENLGYLLLGSNRLTGRIPTEFGRLAKLLFLQLENNRLTGGIPEEFEHLGNLHTLQLHSNYQLTGPLPLKLVGLPLEVISLYNTGLCAPMNPVFQAWLLDIPEINGTYVNCEENEEHLLNREKNLLHILYNSTNGSNWRRSGNWGSPDPLSRWYGITTNAAGRVVEINLENNNLDGSIIGLEAIGILSELKVLNLGSNPSLTGILPTSILGLSLETLHLDGSKVCIPADPDFQMWLGMVPTKSGVIVCEGSDSSGDKDALIELHHATQGLHWHRDANWLSNLPLRDWQGVTTDSEGRVMGLDLSGNNLRGILPPSLVKLDSLEHLDVSGNKLTGQIPAELGQLTKLRHLSLRNNLLSGEIPAELGQLTNLRMLYLSANQFSGHIPAELGQLTRLSVMSISLNKGISGRIPAELGQLTNLTKLRLWRNNLTGEIPAELGQLTNLTELRLVHNNLTGEIPAELGRLTKLNVLSIGENRLAGSIPAELGLLTSLVSLDLLDNRLAGSLPVEIGDLTDLKVLRLGGNTGLTGPIPSSLTRLNLEELRLGGTQLCVPMDADFRAWFQGIGIRSPVADCRSSMNLEVYLTQAVQSFRFPVPLVEGEPALLRVFFATEEVVLNKPPVRVTFYVDGTEVHTEIISAGSAKIPNEIYEGALEISSNAEIPADVIRPGLELVVEVNPGGTFDSESGIDLRMPETGRMAIDVRAVPSFDLTMVPLLWTEGPNYELVQQTEALTAEDDLFWRTRDILPVKDFKLTIREPVWTTIYPYNNPALLSVIHAVRVMDGSSDYYLGVLEGGGGVATAIFGLSELNEPILAHEIGHLMSLDHAPCGTPGDPEYPYPDGSIGAWGYDSRSGQLKHPGSPDIMSYCRNGAWISDYHFNKALYFRLNKEAALAEASSSQARSLLLWGSLDEYGNLSLEPSFVVDAHPHLPQERGQYILTGKGTAGNTLFSLSFEMSKTDDGEGGSFAFTIPVRSNWSNELTQITLTGPEGSVEMNRDRERAAALLLDSATGTVRGILHDWPASGPNTPDARRVSLEPGLEVVVSPGIPDSVDWE